MGPIQVNGGNVDMVWAGRGSPWASRGVTWTQFGLAGGNLEAYIATSEGMNLNV